MQSIGERLEEARKRRGISIREAAEGTKIRGDFLLGFENNQFDVGLPDLYVRGFLRNYAGFLKLEPEKLVTDFNANLIGEAKAQRKESRELFGRMELPEKPRPTGEAASSAGAPVVRRRAEEISEPSSGSARPDTALYLKIAGIAFAGILAILVIVWLVQAIIRSASAPAAPSTPTTTQSEQAAPLETINLIALDAVRVKVTQASDGRELFDGPLSRGETRQVAKRGRVLITYDAGRNLNVEKGGNRFRMPIDGIGRSSFE